MTRKIYIASAGRERSSARSFYRSLPRGEFESTFSWWNEYAEEETAAKLSSTGKSCLKAISDCDIFVLLIPESDLRSGCWVEMGYALATGVTIITVGESSKLDVWAPSFHQSDSAHCDSEHDALNVLRGIAQETRVVSTCVSEEVMGQINRYREKHNFTVAEVLAEGLEMMNFWEDD